MGLVFVGDSVAFGTGDEAGLGGWKGRVSACLAESFTEPTIDDFAVQGAPTADVLAEQCPRMTGRYAVGFAACGANDIIGLHYDGATTLQNLEDIYAALSDVSEVTVVLTIADFVAIRGSARARAVCRRGSTRPTRRSEPPPRPLGHPSSTSPPHRRRQTHAAGPATTCIRAPLATTSSPARFSVGCATSRSSPPTSPTTSSPHGLSRMYHQRGS